MAHEDLKMRMRNKEYEVVHLCFRDVPVNIKRSSVVAKNESALLSFYDRESFFMDLSRFLYLNISIDDNTPGKLKIGFRRLPRDSESVGYLELPQSVIAMAKKLEEPDIELREWCLTITDMIVTAISERTKFPRDKIEFKVETVTGKVLLSAENCWNFSKIIYEGCGADWSHFAMFDE